MSGRKEKRWKRTGKEACLWHDMDLEAWWEFLLRCVWIFMWGMRLFRGSIWGILSKERAPSRPEESVAWVSLRRHSPERMWMHLGLKLYCWSCRKWHKADIPHRSHGSWLGILRFRPVCPRCLCGQCNGLLLSTNPQIPISMKGSNLPLVPQGKGCSVFQQ